MIAYGVVQATDEYAVRLAETMRQADRDELWAASHSLPLDALRRSLRVSHATYVGIADGRPVCMFGVAPLTLLSDVACPWLLGAEELPRHARVFLRANRVYMRMIRKQYAYMANFVDARNVVAIRWLHWLGFTILPAEPYGVERLPFHKFEMGARHV